MKFQPGDIVTVIDCPETRNMSHTRDMIGKKFTISGTYWPSGTTKYTYYTLEEKKLAIAEDVLALVHQLSEINNSELSELFAIE